MLDEELKYLRNRDLYEVYKSGLEKGCFRSMRDAADYVRLQPAPRYYITARTAACYIAKIRAGISLIGFRELARKRIWRIYDRYNEYVSEHPQCAQNKMEEVLEIILEEPAPEFYITRETSRKILQEENRAVRNGYGLYR